MSTVFKVAVFLMVTVTMTTKGKGQEKEKKEKDTIDGCAVPLSLFVPDFRKGIEANSPKESGIRKAAFEILSNKTQKESLKVFSCQNFGDGVDPEKTKPAVGEIEVDGTKWKWEVTPYFRGVEISQDFIRFKCSIHFTISTDNVRISPGVIDVTSRPDRWFYIVRNGGKAQNGAIVPKNAPVEKKK